MHEAFIDDVIDRKGSKIQKIMFVLVELTLPT